MLEIYSLRNPAFCNLKEDNMKTSKKLFCVLIALVMLFGLPSTVYSEDVSVEPAEEIPAL